MGLFDRFRFSGKSQFDFLQSTFSMLGELAVADGKISNEEIHTVERFIDEYLVLTDSERTQALKCFEQAYTSPSSFEDQAKNFASNFFEQPIVLDTVMDVLLQVSIADGEICGEEDRLLHNAAKLFGFTDIHFEQLKALHKVAGTKDTNATYYLRLGLSDDADNETIKLRFQQLLEFYDIDTALEKGVPEAFINVAKKKLEDIEEAYAFLSLQRGFA